MLGVSLLLVLALLMHRYWASLRTVFKTRAIKSKDDVIAMKDNKGYDPLNQKESLPLVNRYSGRSRDKL